MKVYIAGKVSGLEVKQAEMNFWKTEKELHERGFETINPIRLVKNRKEEWTPAMKITIAGMMQADVVYMQPDHVYSSGSTIERIIALSIGMPIFFSMDQLVNYSRIVRKCEEL